MLKYFREDLNAAKRNDPAATSKLMIFLTYPGFHALMWHRINHFLYRIRLRFLARILAGWVRFLTGIEIHPGAQIGYGVFIDHGMGVVIGETSVIGNYVTMYHGVTLGGNSLDRVKRHPTIQDHVTIYAGAAVIGNIFVGEGAKVAAGAVVVKEVPPNVTVAGIPARIVGEPTKQDKDIAKLETQVATLEAKVTQLQQQVELFIIKK